MINHEERATRAWPILALAATQSRDLTYKQLGAELGIHHRACRYVLHEIQTYCQDQGWPILTMVVVNSKTGLPGAGCVVHEPDVIEEKRAELRVFPWLEQENPFGYAATGQTEKQLIDELVNNPSSAGDVYALVKVRGRTQRLFRQALLRVYNNKCALTGLTFTPLLEACHIMPWAQCKDAERLDVRNGILLNSNHHRLFDKGWITFDKDFRLVYADAQEEDGPYTEADRALTLRLHGQPLSLPTNPLHTPAEHYLARSRTWYGWDL